MLQIAGSFMKVLKKQGMKFMLSTKVVGSETTSNGVKLTLEPSAGGEKSTFEADVVLVSTGRRPTTKNIGLEALGIETDKVGRIKVDEHFRTKVPSVFAIGDAIDGPMLAHKAEEEGIACVENIAGFSGHVNYNAIPGVIYTHPEVATVGLTEEQLKQQGVKYNKGIFPFSANLTILSDPNRSLAVSQSATLKPWPSRARKVGSLQRIGTTKVTLSITDWSFDTDDLHFNAKRK
jgi:dihydrolipoamide dehydrogenase